jgi:hypothetical protein
MRCRTPIPTSIVFVTAVSLLTAACGGSSPTAAVSTTSAPNGALAYAHCMRSHGVPTFPDPTNGEAASKQAITSALKAVGNSQAQAATTACMHVNGGSPATGNGDRHTASDTHALLAFAQCMRHHGFVNFPDPGPNGELTRATLSTVGIDLHAPGLANAADACASDTHGVITKATVARFIAGQ